MPDFRAQLSGLPFVLPGQGTARACNSDGNRGLCGCRGGSSPGASRARVARDPPRPGVLWKWGRGFPAPRRALAGTPARRGFPCSPARRPAPRAPPAGRERSLAGARGRRAAAGRGRGRGCCGPGTSLSRRSSAEPSGSGARTMGGRCPPPPA